MAVKPLLSEEEERKAGALLQNAMPLGETKFLTAFYEKLGFKNFSDANFQLVRLHNEIMKETSCDFTMTFRQLGFVKIDDMLDPQVLEKHWALRVFSRHRKYKDFVNLYKQCMSIEGQYHRFCQHWMITSFYE